MNAKELKELIEFLVEKDISEFELERGDVKVRLKRGAYGMVAAMPASTAVAPIAAPAAACAGAPSAAPLPASPSPGAPSPEVVEEANLHIVRSPIVGTFYEAGSPGAPPFVQPGDTVQNGQVLCIIEAMKLMNEIESDGSGTVVKRYVENAQPVEFGQPLFALKK
jgi:acetyl-CoA carboxylase biotin carboxyl carrier protein